MFIKLFLNFENNIKNFYYMNFDKNLQNNII